MLENLLFLFAGIVMISVGVYSRKGKEEWYEEPKTFGASFIILGSVIAFAGLFKLLLK